jgi:hypothetical protein
VGDAPQQQATIAQQLGGADSTHFNEGQLGAGEKEGSNDWICGTTRPKLEIVAWTVNTLS